MTRNTPQSSKKVVRRQQYSCYAVAATIPGLKTAGKFVGSFEKAQQKHSSKQALFQSLKDEWKKIPMEINNNLIASMPRRCREVVKNKGYWTKY